MANLSIGLDSFDGQAVEMDKRGRSLQDLAKRLQEQENNLIQREEAVKKSLEEIEQMHRELDERMAELQHAEQLCEKINKRSESVEHKIRLNIGGAVFMTTRDTLTTEPDTMLRAMFSEEFATQHDEDGEVFIDRNGRHFGTILDHLRGVDVSKTIAALDPAGKHEMEQEVQFYQICSLQELLPEASPETAEASPGRPTEEEEWIFLPEDAE